MDSRSANGNGKDRAGRRGETWCSGMPEGRLESCSSHEWASGGALGRRPRALFIRRIRWDVCSTGEGPGVRRFVWPRTMREWSIPQGRTRTRSVWPLHCHYVLYLCAYCGGGSKLTAQWKGKGEACGKLRNVGRVI